MFSGTIASAVSGSPKYRARHSRTRSQPRPVYQFTVPHRNYAPLFPELHTQAPRLSSSSDRSEPAKNLHREQRPFLPWGPARRSTRSASELPHAFEGGFGCCRVEFRAHGTWSKVENASLLEVLVSRKRAGESRHGHCRHGASAHHQDVTRAQGPKVNCAPSHLKSSCANPKP